MTDAAELVKLADLPTRLRGLVGEWQTVAVSDALEDAADEIERLRAALAAQQDGAREAVIEECAKVATGVMYNGTTTEYQVGWNGACDYIAAKLRSRPEQSRNIGD